jgi:phosphohistidine phosphatase
LIENNKTIIFIRHAKAEPFSNSGKDHDRPISPKGFEQCDEASILLKKSNMIPQIIIASDALRTSQTAVQIGDKIDVKNIRYSSSLYNCETKDIINLLSKLNEEIVQPSLVIHNPAISEICFEMANGRLVDIPTSGIVICEFEREWNSLFDSNQLSLRNIL